MSCGVGGRHSLDPALLLRRPGAAAPIPPLAWELLYALGVALKRPKKKNRSGVAILILIRSSRRGAVVNESD